MSTSSTICTKENISTSTSCPYFGELEISTIRGVLKMYSIGQSTHGDLKSIFFKIGREFSVIPHEILS